VNISDPFSSIRTECSVRSDLLVSDLHYNQRRGGDNQNKSIFLLPDNIFIIFYIVLCALVLTVALMQLLHEELLHSINSFVKIIHIRS